MVKGLSAQGFKVEVEHLMRSAMRKIKKNPPDVVMAEFYHEPAFRDRLSNLESLLAQLQNTDIKTVVFYAKEQQEYLDKVCARFPVDIAETMPVAAGKLARKLNSLTLAG